MQNEKQTARRVLLARRARRGVCITPGITHNVEGQPARAA